MTDNDFRRPTKAAGVMAAPNKSEMKVRILSMKLAEDFPGKWELELNIKKLVSGDGASFAEEGQMVQGFSFEDMSKFTAGDTVNVEAEFIGGPHGGLFNVSNVR